MSEASRDSDKTTTEKPGRVARRALFSVLAAFFGVQSSANRERDVKDGNIGYIILFGFLATAVLIGAIMLLVKILMMQAG